MGLENSQTDEEVVVLARKDQAAFAMLVERYEARLTRYLRRLGVSSDDDASDLLQNIFIKVYRNLNEFDTDLKFSSWIYRIAHNEAVSFFRSRRHAGGEVSFEDQPEILDMIRDENADSAARAEERINAEHVGRALAALDAKYRDVLILRFFEEREYAEISDILRIPTSSVGTLIHRAKRQLRETLAHLT